MEATHLAEAVAEGTPWLHNMEEVFIDVVHVCILALELIGVIVIVVAAALSFYNYMFHKKKDVRLDLLNALALALEFKMGGEILRTVIVREWNEIAVVAAIIAIRTVLNFIIHYEVSHLDTHDAPHDAKLEAIKHKLKSPSIEG